MFLLPFKLHSEEKTRDTTKQSLPPHHTTSALGGYARDVQISERNDRGGTEVRLHVAAHWSSELLQLRDWCVQGPKKQDSMDTQVAQG